MKNQRPVLSISLLSSGRKETIWKCLDSLKPIQEALPTELIIVDTGCDQETHDRMLAYADQVIPFTWCNDFSKARNAGLSLCKGEWFLYIDDDEWFEETAEIISFFSSGEYRNYDLACYIQRNYLDYGEIQHKDAWVSRMIKLKKETHFESPIHEYLCPVGANLKRISDYVKHFGYIFKSEQERKAHSKRNIELLEEAIKREPNNTRWWTHLAQEYTTEPHKLRDVCLEAIELFKDVNDRFTNIQRSVFYAGLLKAERSNMDSVKVEEYAEKAITDKRNSTFCNLMLNTFLAEAYLVNKKYEKAIIACEKYFELYDKIHDDEQLTFEEGVFFVRDALQDERRDYTYCIYISAKLYLNDTSALKTYFHKLGWDGTLYLESNFNKDVMYAMAHLDYDEAFPEIAETMFNRKGPQKELFEILKGYEDKTEEYNRLLRVFSNIESDHYYIDYMKLLYAGQTGNQSLLENSCTALFSKVGDPLQIDDKVYDIIEQRNIDLDSIVKKISFDQWKKGIDRFCEETTIEKMYSRLSLIERMCTDPIRLQYFQVKVAEAAIVYTVRKDVSVSDSEGIGYDDLRKLFVDFKDTTLSFYKSIYRENCFEGEMEFLPPVCRVAAKIKNALASEESSGVMECGKEWLDCVDVFKPFNSAIIDYTKMFAAKQQEKVKNQEQQEMLFLAKSIKASIQTLMEKGDFLQASNVLEQLKAYIPDDEELLMMEDVLDGYLTEE